MKAVIVDLKGKYAAALDETGSVIRIPNAAYTPGQVIQLQEVRHGRTLSLKRIGAVAAAAALILSIGTGSAYAMPYGTVSVDGDSELEYTINCFDYVLGVKALNEEGEALLSEIDEKTQRHCRIEKAVAAAVEQMEQDKQTEQAEQEEEPVRVTASTKGESHSERLQTRLEQTVREHGARPGAAGERPEQPSQESRPDGTTPETAGGMLPQSGTEEAAFPQRPETPGMSAAEDTSGTASAERPEKPQEGAETAPEDLPAGMTEGTEEFSPDGREFPQPPGGTADGEQSPAGPSSDLSNPPPEGMGPPQGAGPAEAGPGTPGM